MAIRYRNKVRWKRIHIPYIPPDRMTLNVLKAKRKIYLQLFDQQIARLKKRGCPEVITQLFNNRRVNISANGGEYTTDDRHIPFLPVIPENWCSIYSQIAMVRKGIRRGFTTMVPPNRFQTLNLTPLPRNLYCIYDIDDGQNLIDKSPDEAQKIIAEQKRCLLTVEEAIALCIHTKILSCCGVLASGTRYHDGQLPNIHVEKVNGKLRPSQTWLRPRLDFLRPGSMPYGMPSCRLRVPISI